jgi:hypothetical protein
MRTRTTGTSSITFRMSVYYIIKATLALFVGLFRRSPTPLEDKWTPTPLRVSIAASVAALLLLFVTFELIRSRRLQERYALLWLLTGVVVLVLAAWRQALGKLSETLGVSYPPSMLSF